MRHGKKNNHLSRTASHRKAMLSNMANSLLEHKRIATTVAKAKALKKFVEPLITKSKLDTTHSRRLVFSKLKQKEIVKMLFAEIAVKVADRPGGYTRIIRTGTRKGDAAEMCIIELVDYNEIYTNEGTEKKKTRRRRKSSGTATKTVETIADTSEKSESSDQLVDKSEEESTSDESKEKEAEK